jgi:Apea-like HEPN
LIDAFRAFTGAILVRLREAVATSEVEQRLRRWVVFEGESYRDDGEFRPHYWPLLESIQDAKLWDDFAVASSVKVLFDEGVLFTPNIIEEGGKSKAKPTFDDMRPDLVRHLMSPVARLIDDANSLEPSEEVIHDAAVRFVLSRTEPQPWSLSIPLIDLSSEVVPLTFGRLTLASLADEEKSRLWGTGSIHVEMIRLFDLLRASLQLGYSAVHEKAVKMGMVAVGPLESELRLEAGDVVTALRLQKDGEVGAPIYVHLEADVPMGMGNQISYLTPDNLLPEQYELRTSDVASVQETFAALRTARANGKLRLLEVPLRRFHQSYARRGGDDRIIDFAIAFEATVLQDVREELGYRLALRTGALLRDTDDPASTSSFMKQFYAIRSKIVHEGLPFHVAVKKHANKLGSADPADFVRRSADLLRASLRRYVLAAASGNSVEQVNANLDAAILSGLTPKQPAT